MNRAMSAYITGLNSANSLCQGETEENPDEPHLLEPIDCFALVTYIPPPLGLFLDRLRCDLELNSHYPRAHVTILPPRPLRERATIPEACGELGRLLPECEAFNIIAGRIEIFPASNVVFLSIAEGFPELTGMHSRLNQGPLTYHEAYAYCPHITLAQGLCEQRVQEVAEEATRLWAAYAGPLRFQAEVLIFVQNSVQNHWVDLAEYRLPREPEMAASIRTA